MAFKKINSLLINHSLIIKNFSYLGFLQIFQLFIPLLIYPYLIRVIGGDLYGKVIFVQNIISYLIILINYGFDIEGTRSIAIHRDDADKVSEIASALYIIRISLFLISFVFMNLIGSFFDFYQDNFILFLFSFGLCFQVVLFPVWYFQGKESMQFIAYVNFISRLLYLLLVFLLIKKESDYYLLPLLSSIGFIVGGMYASYVILYKEKVKFKWVSFAVLIGFVKDSFAYFLTNISIALVEKTNVVLLGMFVGMKGVAYYDLASKIVQLAKTPFSIVMQVLFPSFSKDLNKNKMKNALLILGSSSLLVYIVLIVFGTLIVRLLGGDAMLEAKNVLLILGLTLPLVAISIVFGLGLAARGHSREFMMADIIYLVTYLLFLSSCYVCYQIDIYVLSFALVIGVLFNCVYKYNKIRKYEIL